MWDRRNFVIASGAMAASMAFPTSLSATAGKTYRVPVDLASGRLLVACTIEGKGPFLLGIDTGGVVSIIQADLAARLDLARRGKTPLGLAGQHELFPMFEAREMVFGNAFRQERVLLAGVEGIRLGRDVLGMLAAGCMTTMDSELDFEAREWRLYPDGGPERAGWTVHEQAIRPTRIGSPHLFGRAQFGGQPIRCLLDTGAPGTIVLPPKIARKGGIDLDGQNWSPTQINGNPARIYRSAQPFEIGGLSIDRPLVTVNKATPGWVDDGIVGLALLQRLNLATEVKARRLWTRPNMIQGQPERYNLSGLWVDRQGGTLSAGIVGKGSPAEKAGIIPGDRIEGAGFGELIARLNGRVGETVAFKISRGGVKRDLTLVLDDYL